MTAGGEMGGNGQSAQSLSRPLQVCGRREAEGRRARVFGCGPVSPRALPLSPSALLGPTQRPNHRSDATPRRTLIPGRARALFGGSPGAHARRSCAAEEAVFPGPRVERRRTRLQARHPKLPECSRARGTLPTPVRARRGGRTRGLRDSNMTSCPPDPVPNFGTIPGRL